MCKQTRVLSKEKRFRMSRAGGCARVLLHVKIASLYSTMCRSAAYLRICIFFFLPVTPHIV